MKTPVNLPKVTHTSKEKKSWNLNSVLCGPKSPARSAPWAPLHPELCSDPLLSGSSLQMWRQRPSLSSPRGLWEPCRRARASPASGPPQPQRWPVQRTAGFGKPFLAAHSPDAPRAPGPRAAQHPFSISLGPVIRGCRQLLSPSLWASKLSRPPGAGSPKREAHGHPEAHTAASSSQK